ncbi:hypothetical protein ACWF0M_00710 [Kribbella sp. NPDC055110]
MAPRYLVRTDPPFTFLGQPCGEGVNPVMAERLEAVEADLRVTHAAQMESGETYDDFETWCGLHEQAIGWRSHAGHHGSGSAVDLNYTTTPYIVTRTGRRLGGEAAAADQQAMRERAAGVYDRAVWFLEGDDAPRADLSIRVTDTIEVAYDRFRRVSDALTGYLSWAVSPEHIRVERPPIPDVQELPDGDERFLAIPPSELNGDAASAIASLAKVLDDEAAATSAYYQMLRDYELVRIPMLFGNPARPVTETRNPAHGFLDLRREVVVSLITVGSTSSHKMRWGACDFGVEESGDVMHFDLGSDAGYEPA